MSIFSKAYGKNKNKNKNKKSSNLKPEQAQKTIDEQALEDENQIASEVQKEYSAAEKGAIDIPLGHDSSTKEPEVIDLSNIDLNMLDIDLGIDMDNDTLSPAVNMLQINPLKSFSHQVEIDLEGLQTKGYITPANSNDQLANTFRVIKRPLLNNATGKGAALIQKGNMIMITSAMNGEGKSFSAINLAISVAMEKDKHVLLIDADVNKPSHHQIFGIPMESGLIDLLLGKEKDMSQVLHKTNIPSLSLMFAGKPSSQATELLASESMDRFVEEVASRYPDRIVIFDSPPLLLTTESSVLASYMGQVVMVVEAERTLRHHVIKGLEQLSNDVVLMLLNKMREKNELGNYGYGAYGYGHKP
jgi:receptor protein-tyrosine kinase